MQNLTNKRYFTFALIGVWFVVVVSGLVYFQLGQLKPFDENKMLERRNWFSQFKEHVVWQNKDSAQLLIITEDNCGCTIQAKPHLSALQRFAKNQGVEVQTFKLNSQLKSVVPATPAAVLIDKNGEFVYAGPLSEGLACSQGSGFVETVISNLQAGFNSSLLIANTKGCYCINRA